jgi:hypothetical protein
LCHVVGVLSLIPATFAFCQKRGDILVPIITKLQIAIYAFFGAVNSQMNLKMQGQSANDRLLGHGDFIIFHCLYWIQLFD